MVCSLQICLLTRMKTAVERFAIRSKPRSLPLAVLFQRAFPYSQSQNDLSAMLRHTALKSVAGERKEVRIRVAMAGRRIISALCDWLIPALVFVSRYSPQHLKERVNLVEAVIGPETDAYHSWFSGFVSCR